MDTSELEGAAGSRVCLYRLPTGRATSTIREIAALQEIDRQHFHRIYSGRRRGGEQRGRGWRRGRARTQSGQGRDGDGNILDELLRVAESQSRFTVQIIALAAWRSRLANVHSRSSYLQLILFCSFFPQPPLVELLFVLRRRPPAVTLSRRRRCRDRYSANRMAQ